VAEQEIAIYRRGDRQNTRNPESL